MDDGLPFYKGHEGFNTVIADERLARIGRAIRVYNYGGIAREENIYVLGTEGQLFDSRTKLKVNPVDVLSLEKAPDGWSIEGWFFDGLPPSELEKLAKNS